MEIEIDFYKTITETRIVFNGENLKRFRAAKGFSQKKFANAIGISTAFMCDIEKGNRSPGPETTKKIFKVLGIKAKGE